MTDEAMAQESPEATVPENSDQAVDTDANTQQTGSEEEAPQQGETSEDEGKGRWSKRVKKLTEQRDQLKRSEYELQTQLEAIKAEAEQLRQVQNQQQLASAGEIPMPRFEDYGYDENAYTQAVQNWHKATVEAQTQKQQELAQQHQLQVQQQQQQAALATKVTQATEKYPDFMLKVNDPNIPSLNRINPVAFQAVTESESFADVAYYLASNPSEVYEFSQLSPIQAVRKVTQLEAQLSAKPMTNAPPPAPPSEVGGRGEQARNPMDLPIDEWMRYMDSKDPKLKR